MNTLLRPDRVRWSIRQGLIVLCCLASLLQAEDQTRPSFLFLIADDMSPNLGCYGDPDAKTPNLDAFAASSIRYTRAFSAAGVCATSRSALITGMHPSSLGTQHMRSKIKLPDDIRPFPVALREAGYFCVNRGKEDFNFDTKADVWDAKQWKKADWTRRAEGQPFFAIYNYLDTHESRLWEGSETVLVDQTKLQDDQRHDPDKVTLPKWLPDDARVRKEWARYQDLVSLMDDQYIGPMLRHLEKTGVADDTIVFFFSDHGAPFPRAKQWITEAGTRVPLLIHFPEKWKHLAPSGPGTTSDQLVSLMDLGPSILSLAGIDVPDSTDGRAFLGEGAALPRETLVFTRDRMDERVDFIRTMRDKRYRYTRNFLPLVPAFPWLTYMEKLESSKEFRRLQETGNEGRFSTFLARTKPGEELYDLEADPDEFTNLATDPAHGEALKRLRDELSRWMLETRDSGFLPEQQLMKAEQEGGSIREYCADESRYPLQQLVAGEGSLEDEHAVVRYHVALRSDDLPAMRKQLKEESDSDVRVALAWAMGRAGAKPEEVVPIFREVIESDQSFSRIFALNALDYLGDTAKPLLPLLEKIAAQKETPDTINESWLAKQILLRFP
ncbi:MAG: sulfatase-like hydrolase/transferase [Verrucomicrobiales bacterium]|nr:sulfatase-like hydrolase/transferase [Verrucomicrobiales bacterium]